MGLPKRKKQRLLLVRQHDETDCAAACLSSISTFYGGKASVATVRYLAGTDKSGTSVAGMVEAALAMGFDAKGVKTAFASLQLTTLPAIAHIVIRKGSLTYKHFIVIVEATERWVKIMDPAYGEISKLRRARFESMWSGITILLYPNQTFRKEKKQNVLNKVLLLAASRKSELTFCAICSVMVSMLGVSLSVYAKEIIDSIIPGRNSMMLGVLSGIVLIIIFLQFIIGTIKNRLILRSGLQLNSTLVISYYAHVMSLPLSFARNMRTGEIISRVNDALKVTGIITDAAVNIVVDLMIIVCSLVVMFIYNSTIAVLILGVVPVYGLLLLISSRINKRRQRLLTECAASFEAHLVESISCITSIREVGAEKRFISETKSNLAKLNAHMYGYSVRQTMVQSTADLASKFFTVVLLWVGSYYTLSNQLSVGELVAFYTLLGYFSGPVLYLLTATKSFGEARVAAERLFDIMELETVKYGCKKVATNIAVEISLENVHFGYRSNTSVLKGINLVIKPAAILGIKGKSGCGKSTLISLLLNQNTPTSGTICANGIPVNEIDKETLHTLFAVVSQHTALFTGTVADNIMIGCEPDDKWLNELIVRLGITSFTSDMPRGLETMIAEGASNLSGGQRQKIAIARGMFRKAAVLILDEATTSVDDGSEDIIMQTIEWYRNLGNTVIIVAHNDHTMKICDNIAVLEGGVIT